jgi:predicted CXXCH cytochrome family protein
MGNRTVVDGAGESEMVSDSVGGVVPRFLIAIGVIGILLVAMAGTAAALELEPEGQGPRWNSEGCLDCHDGSEDALTFPSGQQLSVGIDGAAFRETHQTPHARLSGDVSRSLTSGVQCVHCHTSITGVPHEPVAVQSAEAYSAGLATTCSQCHWRQYTIALDEAHALLDPAVRGEAPDCVDCHDPHAPEANALAGAEMQATCGGCHAEQVGEELAAIHTLNPTVVEQAEAPSLIWFYVLIVGAVLGLVAVLWGIMEVIDRGRRRFATAR